jgi:hypothetical protein
MLLEVNSQKFVDIFLLEEVSGKSLVSAIGAICGEFLIDPEKSYSGYLGLNVKRLTGLMMLMRLRDVIGVRAFNVPIRYRDCPNIGFEEAKWLAKQRDIGDGRYAADVLWNPPHPMYLAFKIAGGDGSIAGGAICVDQLDGHIWSGDELDEYSHDYNNAFWVV